MIEKSLIPKRHTRQFPIGTKLIGGDASILVQSMCATRTTDIPATLAQIRLLEGAGADLIRIAIDSKNDVQALREIRKETAANLVIDLQESYRLALDVAPYVQKFRYNPGHLYHHQRSTPLEEKVKFLADVAGQHNCAMRIGVNFGSLDPELKASGTSSAEVAVQSAREHAELLEKYDFKNFVVSLKSSDPRAVVEINKRFASMHPEIPLHLGVTEAGLLPEGEIKTRIAFEQLISLGIGDTVRVSLTLPDAEKYKEIEIARTIIDDIAHGRFRSVPEALDGKLNVISCPSCSRVENAAFVKLAQEVKSVLQYASEQNLTIAVMGCRVNGPGETDEADLGLWCGPKYVNLKRGEELVGAFPYEEVVGRLIEEVNQLLAARQAA